MTGHQQLGTVLLVLHTIQMQPIEREWLGCDLGQMEKLSKSLAAYCPRGHSKATPEGGGTQQSIRKRTRGGVSSKNVCTSVYFSNAYYLRILSKLRVLGK